MPYGNKCNPSSERLLAGIKKSVYAIASVDGLNAELTMYGEICEKQPVDWWTGEPISGNFILLDEFLQDLEAVKGCKSLTVRMNSYGGDAGVSNTIHNRLRDLARAGTELTCIVDGVAMSGGSLIMCACDTIKANPSSLIMIHKCQTTLFGGYNADDLRNLAAQLDAWDQMQVEIYQRKTGLSSTVLSHMMADTTYMTGSEAVEKGFVDELLEDAEPVSVAASKDGRSIFVRGKSIRLMPGTKKPDATSDQKAKKARQNARHSADQILAAFEAAAPERNLFLNGGMLRDSLHRASASQENIIEQARADARAYNESKRNAR